MTELPHAVLYGNGRETFHFQDKVCGDEPLISENHVEQEILREAQEPPAAPPKGGLHLKEVMSCSGSSLRKPRGLLLTMTDLR